MDEHSNRSFALAHYCRHFADVEVTDDPQRHRLALIGWQPTNQRQGPVEVIFGEHISGLWESFGDDLPTAPGLAQLIDDAASGDREQPTPEVVLVAAKVIDVAGDVDPHSLGDIFGVGRKPASEVAQNPRVMGRPQNGERPALSGASTTNYIVGPAAEFHADSVGRDGCEDE